MGEILKSDILKLSVLFLFGLIMAIAVFYFSGIEGILNYIFNLNIFYYSLSIFCVFLTILFWAFRWNVFIRQSGYKVPLLNLLGNLFVGITINNFTPVAKFGGEPIRIYLLYKKNHVQTRIGSATVLAELTVDFVVSLFLVITSILLITIFGNTPIWLSFILILFLILSFIGFSCIVGIYSSKKFIIRAILWFINKIKRVTPFREKIMKWYNEFQKEFKKSIKNKNIFLISLFFGILMKIFDLLKFLFIFLALGYQINLIQILIAMGIGIVLMSIPATPGNLGILEGGLISAFVLIGIPLQIAAAAVFLERILWFWGVNIIGLSLGAFYGVKMFEKHSL